MSDRSALPMPAPAGALIAPGGAATACPSTCAVGAAVTGAGAFWAMAMDAGAVRTSITAIKSFFSVIKPILPAR